MEYDETEVQQANGVTAMNPDTEFIVFHPPGVDPPEVVGRVVFRASRNVVNGRFLMLQLSEFEHELAVATKFSEKHHG